MLHTMMRLGKDIGEGRSMILQWIKFSPAPKFQSSNRSRNMILNKLVETQTVVYLVNSATNNTTTRIRRNLDTQSSVWNVSYDTM